ncbi:hypothetical protein V8E51_014788 [Hyaloscypha variabilis]
MAVEEISAYFVIVECIFVIITLLLALYTYVAGAVDQAAREDIGRACCEKRQMAYFVAPPPKWWSYYRRRGVTRIPKVPTVDNLLQAGDRLLFTSAIFDHIDPSSQEVGWVTLYKQFFREMSWLDDERTREARKDSDISKYLKKADKRRINLQNSAWTPATPSDAANMTKNRRGDEESGHLPGATTRDIVWKPNSEIPVRHCLFPPRSKRPPMMVCCVLPLETARSEAGSTSVLADLTLPDLRSLWIVNAKPCIEVSREELAGLALALGVCLSKETDGSFSGSGPFGTHIRVQRHMGREPLNGSGYSTLFAKYIAGDCLPLVMVKSEEHRSDRSAFPSDRGDKDKVLKCVRCIHVTPRFLASIRGRPDTYSFGAAVKRLRNAIERKRSALSKAFEIMGRVPVEHQKSPEATALLQSMGQAQRGLWTPEPDLEPVLQEVVISCQQLKYLDRLPAAHKIEAYYYPQLDSTDFDGTSGTSESDIGEIGVGNDMPSPEVDVRKDEKENQVEVEVREENYEDLIKRAKMIFSNIDKGSDMKKLGGTLHWFRAVARIAFGGLVPQAGKLVADAVCFTVMGLCREDHDVDEDKAEQEGDGGRGGEVEDDYKALTVRPRNQSSASEFPDNSLHPPAHSASSYRGRSPTHTPKHHRDRSCENNGASYSEFHFAPWIIISALKNLLEELQKECYNCYGFKLFGEYVDGIDHRQSERAKLEWMSSSRATISTTSDSGDLFSRYMTALERLVAISWHRHEEALRKSKGSKNINGDARGANSSFGFTYGPWPTDYRGLENMVWNWGFMVPGSGEQNLLPYVQEVYEKCVELIFKDFVTENSSSGSQQFRLWAAARIVLSVREKLKSKTELISVEDCANVAICIIAAWAMRVPSIELELEASKKRSKRPLTAVLNDLPPVMAFG